MKISSTNFINDKDQEKLLVMFVKDDEGNEKGRLSFYLKQQDSNLKKELNESFLKLPGFIEDIYNMGLKGEKVSFDTSIVPIS